MQKPMVQVVINVQLEISGTTCMGEASPVIRLTKVCKQYETYEHPALQDVSLWIRKGDFVFITGPSGAGKSTLLKLIFLSERPSSGTITVEDKNLDKLKPREVPYLRRAMGVVFQDFKLIDHLTVAENVAFTLHVLGLPHQQVVQKTQHVLKQVGLIDKVDALPRRLSGGEQQRVAIARALVHEPRLLLADEPTGNLDDAKTVEIMDLLVAANQRGTTVVVATHDQAILSRYHKRVVRIQEGRVAETPYELLYPPRASSEAGNPEIATHPSLLPTT